MITRWMALDIGSKRFGVAITDPLKLTSRPLLTMERSNLKVDVEKIADLIVRYNVERLIVGRPLYLNGEISPSIEKISPLVMKLRQKTPVPVVWMNESLSTKEADFIMHELRIQSSERRKKKDEFSAALILKWYMEEKASPSTLS